MQVDFQQLLSAIHGTEMGKRFQRISKLDAYTHLAPPYKVDDIREIRVQIEQTLSAKLMPDYLKLMACCDGGMLFTTDVFSLYSPDKEDRDLSSINLSLWNKQLLTDSYIAIAICNYGDYICIDRAGRSNGLISWSVTQQSVDMEYESIAVWLDSEIDVAEKLHTEHLLPLIDQTGEAE